MVTPMRASIFITFFLILGFNCYGSTLREVVFFRNTSFPLKCYFLKGESKGPTIMVQGGIQGDEISGIITAETLVHSKVKKKAI